MNKNIFAIILCMMYCQTANCNALEEFAKTNVETILKRHHLENSVIGPSNQAGFRSLSPELVNGIAKSFYLLKEFLPDLLEGGSYLEFGLYRGFSLWFAQQMGNSFVEDFQYFGFDSFAGLPDRSQDYFIDGSWAPGVYAVSLEEVNQNLHRYGANFSNLHLIKGWYGPQVFGDWEGKFGGIKPAIITIDSDTYESCNEVLAWFCRFIQPGTILLFDDFCPFINYNTHGERKSIIEFLETHPDFRLMHLFSFGWPGYAFIVTSCHGQSLDNEVVQKIHGLIGRPTMPYNFEAVPYLFSE